MIIEDHENSSDEEVRVTKKERQFNSSCFYGWKDLFLSAEILRALRECGFQQPSEIQSQAIPYALEGQDLLCQAKSGMGKTAVFVISVLNSLKQDKHGEFITHQCIVLAHTRELAHQIYKDFRRLGKYFRQPVLKIGCFIGGTNMQQSIISFGNQQTNPHIIIATPGRLKSLLSMKLINLSQCRYFILDQCDKMLTTHSMREDIVSIFERTPKAKQVMMFSATFTDQSKRECFKMMNKNPVVLLLPEEKLILHGLTQYYIRISEEKKFDKLMILLDGLPFNQVIIFVNKIQRAKILAQLLTLKLFNPICIHSGLRQEERIHNYDLFKANGSRILIATDLFGRGIDIERVNLVINYDFPQTRDTYLHRVGRAGRFGTRGLAINLIRTEELMYESRGDEQVLKQVQQTFKIKIKQMPNELNISHYM